MATITSPVAAGQVSTTGVSYNNIGANTLTLDGDIVLVAPSTANAVEFLNAGTGATGAWTVTIKGGAYTYNGYAINFLNDDLPSGKNTLTVTADGAVYGGTVGAYATSLTDVTNNGSIAGLYNGILYDGINPDNNLNTASGVLNTKILTVTNNVGAEISATANAVEVFGIGNLSGALLKVTNNGSITGSQSVYVDEDDDQTDDGVYEGAAIRSDGGLNLTNSATGEIHGGIESDWVKNTVINSGKIYGTINFAVNSAYVNIDGYVDMDRDSDFNDGTGAVLSNTLVNTITNNANAVIEGAWDYAYDNAGTDSDTGDDAKFQVALDLDVGADKITNNGTIHGSISTGRDNDTLTNGVTGEITGRIKMGDGSDTLTNNGNIFANDNINDFNDSTIGGSYVESGIDLGYGNNILTNTGHIDGVVHAEAGDDKLTNSGTISDGVDLGNGISTISNLAGGTIGNGGVTGGNEADTLINAGLIQGAVYLDGGSDVVTNSGVIGGRLNTHGGYFNGSHLWIDESGIDPDTITNTATGHIFDGIVTGDGKNIITNQGIIQGDVSTGDAGAASGTVMEKITNSGSIAGSILTGNGDRTITNSGLINNDITTGTGKDVLVNSKDVLGTVSLGNGDNTATNSGTIWQGLNSGTGRDIITNTGVVYEGIDSGDGNDKVINSKTVFGDISTDDSVTSGSDEVQNSGTVYGDVDVSNGGSQLLSDITGNPITTDYQVHNLFRNTGFVYGDVYAGSGIDNVINSKLIDGQIQFYAGKDLLTNSGTINGEVDMGDGGSTVVNTGTIHGDFIGGVGADSLTNKKLIAGDVTLGSGADNNTETLDNTLGTIKGLIDLGGGSDTLKGGAGAEHVVDNLGGDTYLLGAGDDYIEATDDLGGDTYDGGAGKDTIDFSGLVVGVTVNLTSSASANVAYGAASETDTIKGIETVWGSNQIDVLIGSAAADTLGGNDGGDFIRGAGGADRLYGGHNDGDTDRFIYNLASDSGITKVARDVIFDFEDAHDVLELNFDSNSTNVVDDHSFSLVASANSNFTSSIGEIRYYYHGNQTIVEADTDGNGKADWSVALDGIHALTLTNFDWAP